MGKFGVWKMKSDKAGSKYIKAGNYSRFAPSVPLIEKVFQCLQSKQEFLCPSLKAVGLASEPELHKHQNQSKGRKFSILFIGIENLK